MWTYLVRHILRNRLGNLIAIFLLTGFMAYMASQVKISYTMARMLPASDSTSIEYELFKEKFGQDGSVMFIGIQEDDLYSLDKFNAWYDLTYKIKEIEGIEEVLSLAKIYYLKENDSSKINFLPVITRRPETQEELDSIAGIIKSLPFYEEFLYNKETNATLMMITLDQEILNSKDRVQMIADIKQAAQACSAKLDTELYYSGLPYIRTVTAKTLQDELLFFVFLAAGIAALILFIFFRSARAVFFPLLIMSLTVVWVLGSISLFGYEITILTSILPPLVIIIVVENCIFLLNKYYDEYRTHKNKVKALSRMVQRIGTANLLTNATTAAGFAAFTVTGNQILTEFGIIASLNILVAYILTLFLIPIFFSYLPPPKPRHTKHLEKGLTTNIVDKLLWVVQHRRNTVYILVITLICIGIFGVTRLETTGNIVDDISKSSKLSTDLMFLEKHFKGVMPLEISIDTKEKGGIFKNNARTLYKIKRLHKVFTRDSLFSPYFSRPLSIVDGISFFYQAHKGGDPKYYILPPPSKLQELKQYTSNIGSGKAFHSFIDSLNQVTRVSIQMANIGTKDIEWISDSIQSRVDNIFPTKEYDVSVTGTSIVFLKGTNYLVRNLVSSLILALVIISFLMALLFTSFRMIFLSLIPNLIPLLLTAALMGFLGISIKPSTILIFSIALGISVDNAIHFLSRYRLQLKWNNWKIKVSVLEALRETGYSMIYSSVVLFFGFAIFILSSFGGTEALGYLISFTLVIALLCNMFLLPSLLLSLDKKVTTKRFKEPFLDILDDEDDEEDIDMNKFEIEKI